MTFSQLSFDLRTLRAAYLDGTLTPTTLIDEVLRRIGDDPYRAWITVLDRDQLLAYTSQLDGKDIAALPLYGIPFAIKDNIDLAGIPTTAACPEFAYTPGESAFVVQQLVAAGAIPIGKTNLDQFATGLNGTRTPYGACRNSHDPDYISGGSSSGSAVAVALGQVSFSLGTDTAGSGRVPAAFNHIMGLKPSLGRLSTRGVVPACRTLDCVSIFALNAADTEAVLAIAGQFDAAEPYARAALPATPIGATFHFGVPRAEQLQFFGDADASALFDQAVARLTAIGGHATVIDFEPFLAAARLLYEGPWVAERYAAIRTFFDAQSEHIHPAVHSIVGAAQALTAADAYSAMYRLQALRHAVAAVWHEVDVIVTPTAGTIYRIAEMEADPIRLNSNLGYYTNFMNLLDLAAIAAPAGFRKDGLPWGVTLFAPAGQDAALTGLVARWEAALGLPSGAPAMRAARDGAIPIVVCGAHLSGLPLNWQLQARGATLIKATQSAPRYRLYALAGGPPFRPGMIRDETDGAAIDVEVWALPTSQWGSFVAGIPAPLGIGTVELADGTWAKGFICEGFAKETATDITHFGGWRAYLAQAR